MSARAGRQGRGLWREAPLVLPLALVLFAALGWFALASYRAAVERFALERETEALALAARVAESLAAEGERVLERQLRLLPPGTALAILDASGQPFETVGFAPGSEASPAAIVAALPAAPTALGPERAGSDAVVALQPFHRGPSREAASLDGRTGES